MSWHGEYDFTVTGPDGPVRSHAAIDGEDGKLTGTLTFEGQTTPVVDGTFSDFGEFSFKTHISTPDEMDLVFNARCDDTACSTVSGTVTAPGIGTFPLKGARV